MREVVLILLVSALLAGLTESYSVKGISPYTIPVPQIHSQVVGPKIVQSWESQSQYADDQISSSSKDNDGSFIASEETEEGKLWLSDEDPDWKPPVSQKSAEDGPFTASEETENGEWWISDEKPDYIPSESQTYSRSFHPAQRHQGDYHKMDYQTSQQAAQVPNAPGGWQDRLDSGSRYVIQESDEGGRPGVALGVEPLLPVAGPSQQEVATGVEPVRGGVTDDKDEDHQGSSFGGWLQRGWGTLSGTVLNLGNQARDTFSSFDDVADKVVDKIHQTYHGVRGKLRNLLERFKGLLKKFGILIQEGIRYCLRRFDHASDQVQESTVFEKLERGLEKGHVEVQRLFQILGEKVNVWREQNTEVNIDEGLIEGYTQEEQNQQMDEMPDFFQDAQVLDQLSRLEQVGVLTQGDIIILTQEHPNQYSQSQHQNQQQQNQNQQEQQNQNQQEQQNQYQEEQQNQYQQEQQQNQNQQEQQNQYQQEQQNQYQQEQQQNQNQQEQQNQYQQEQQQNQNQQEQQNQYQQEQQQNQNQYSDFQQQSQVNPEIIQFPV